MEKIIIKGGQPLRGKVAVEGSKNAVLPLQAAAILAVQGTVTLNNVPPVTDVKVMDRLLGFLNSKTAYGEKQRQLVLNASFPLSSEAPYDYVNQMRASLLVMGPLLARTGHVRIALPGGCSIGARPIDLHLAGLEKLGAEIKQDAGFIEASCEHLVGTRIPLDFPSVGATENIMMAATMAAGITTIENASCEPEIIELGNLLNKMGAHVHGAGSKVIRIQGVYYLHGAEYTVIPDRIEAGTWMLASAVTNGDVIVQGTVPEHNASLIAKLEEMGVTIIKQADGLRVLGTSVLIPANVKTMPYPGFPTDLQPQMTVLQLLANGTSTMEEHVFEKRFIHLEELRRMNAKFQISGSVAIIDGPTRFSGAEVTASDLRAGASLVLAGLAADGITQIRNPQCLDRGYYHFYQKLRALGAKIDRLNIEDKFKITPDQQPRQNKGQEKE